MIIVRSPLRITLGGGGTDLPSYYRQFGGLVLSAAIDRYVYITLHETFEPTLIVRYSRMETVRSIDEVQHPIVRAALLRTLGGNPSIEIASMADIPAGTGLGSSGSFTTALLKALHAYRRNSTDPAQLAAEACSIEIDELKEPIGKQDQYIAAFGGVTLFEFHPDESVDIRPLRLSADTVHNLQDNLLLFYTGHARSASDVLRDQDVRTKAADQEMLSNLHFVKEIGMESQVALEAGELRRFAELMNVHWQHKKRRSTGMSNGSFDRWYDVALDHGALGGKLIGAGGGGFLMFYSENNAALRRAMAQEGLREVHFRFDFEGTKVLVQ